MVANTEHHAKLNIQDQQGMLQIIHALDSPVRLDILRLLGKHSMISVGEIAQQLGLPVSTTALGVKILEEAGIIGSKLRPGIHGSTKLCWIHMSQVSMLLSPGLMRDHRCVTLPMPVGGFSAAEQIQPTCGLISSEGVIGLKDTPSSFYLPERFQAQLVWFYSGYLEYRFALPVKQEIDWLELSFESCSEAPMYKDPWLSDIYVDFNGLRLGQWTSPCDCGGRHGMLTPEWWSDDSTQFGFMKAWRVDNTGSYLDQRRIGDVTIDDLCLKDKSYISVRIGVDPEAEHVGGINLFGDSCGDFSQGLILRIGVI